MKRVLFYGMIILLFLAVFDSTAAYILKDEDIEPGEAAVLMKTFEASGADFLEMNVYSTLHLPDIFFSMEELEEIGNNLMQRLQMKGEVHFISNQDYYSPVLEDESMDDGTNRIFIEKNEDIGYNQIMVTALKETGEVTVLKLYAAEIDKIKESYIIIDIVQNKGYKDIGAIINRHNILLEEYGDSIETTAAITAVRNEKMTTLQKQKWINEMVKATRAKKIEEVIQSSYTSTTLYTPYIPYTLNYDNKKVNLQLATRYNDYEKSTYLWIATPLVTNTY